MVVAGFFFFTDTYSKPNRYIAGFIHAVSHLSVNLFLGWIVTRITVHTFSLEPGGICQLLASGFGIFAGGYLAGSLLMGIYLLVSLNLFGRHSNEAFSSLRIQGYKNFLKLHICKDGKLTIYPVGIKKVPKKWVPAEKPGEGDPKYVPKDNQPVNPFLIENPIEVSCPKFFAEQGK